MMRQTRKTGRQERRSQLAADWFVHEAWAVPFSRCGREREGAKRVRKVREGKGRWEKKSSRFFLSDVEYPLFGCADMYLPVIKVCLNEYISRQNRCGNHRFLSGGFNHTLPCVCTTGNDESKGELPFLQRLTTQRHALYQTEITDLLHTTEIHLAGNGFQTQNRSGNFDCGNDKAKKQHVRGLLMRRVRSSYASYVCASTFVAALTFQLLIECLVPLLALPQHLASLCVAHAHRIADIAATRDTRHVSPQ